MTANLGIYNGVQRSVSDATRIADTFAQTVIPLSRTASLSGGSYVGSSLVPVLSGTQGTVAVGNGTMFFAPAVHNGASLTRLTVVPTATALGASEGVFFACYGDSQGAPSDLVWQQFFSIGNPVANTVVTGLDHKMPVGRCWLAVLNPSGNAGSVTFRSHTVLGQLLTDANDSVGQVLNLTSVAALPHDLSRATLRTAPLSGVFGLQNSGFPRLIANTTR